jgi:cell division protein FtsI (penicillin-binding protein 3)
VARTPSRPRKPIPSPPRRRSAKVRSPQSSFVWPDLRANPSIGRLRIVWLALLVACGLLSLNLLRIQVIQAPELMRIAKSQQMTYLRPFVPRRPVIDRTGNVLAIDRPVFTLYAHPRYFDDKKDQVAKDLSPILGKPAQDLLNQFNQAKSGIKLAEELPEDTAKRIEHLVIDGLELLPNQQRFYPQQGVQANIIGYVDNAQQAQAGVEYSMEHLLKQSPKAVRLNRTGEGTLMPEGIPSGFVHQDDLRLQLTIDSRMQRAIAPVLARQVANFGAKRGLVLVMDAKDGAIRAMVSDPTFDPNKYYEVNDLATFKNWALTDLYEPGSTFKPLVVAMALESGALKATDHVYDSGYLEYDGWPIYNSDRSARGSISLTEVVQYSSNIGMVEIGRSMKPDVYYSWLERLGLGQATGIDLPFEAVGQMRDRKTFTISPLDRATTSFGQGFSLTPVQLLKLHGLLASGGKMVTPHVVQGLYDSSGKAYWEPKRAMPKQIFSPKNTQAVLRMMEAVVEYGTGKTAQVPGYRVGGKTGTAQKAGSNGYIEGANITSFIGIFPVDQPRYVVLAVLDEPQGANAYGGTTAAPIVKEVIETVAGLESVPLSKSDEELASGKSADKPKP